MEILVKGEMLKTFKPDQIEINYTFNYKGQSYEKIIELGTKAIENYVNLLERLNIKRQDFKTTFFRVEEDKVYNENLKTYELKGYKYVYGAKLTLKYDMKKLEEIILNTAKFGDFVSYRLNFALKDRNAADSELLAGAYKNAKIQADSIAKVAGLQISKCLKTSFQPLERDFYSRNAYESSRASVQFAKSADFQNIFIPEDIEVEREIYCVFLAE